MENAKWAVIESHRFDSASSHVVGPFNDALSASEYMKARILEDYPDCDWVDDNNFYCETSDHFYEVARITKPTQ